MAVGAPGGGKGCGEEAEEEGAAELQRHGAIIAAGACLYGRCILKAMPVTKVFRSGNSQAVRIPQGFRFHSDEVEILRRGEEIVLRERPRSLARAFDLLAGLSADFFEGGRRQRRAQKRPGL